MLTVFAEFFYLNSACQGLSKYKRKYLAQTGHVNLISGQSEKSDKRPISVGVSSPNITQVVGLTLFPAHSGLESRAHTKSRIPFLFPLRKAEH
jgi:hypothetical protein